MDLLQASAQGITLDAQYEPLTQEKYLKDEKEMVVRITGSFDVAFPVVFVCRECTSADSRGGHVHNGPCRTN